MELESKDEFKFKKFHLRHQEGVMKTGFDGVLLGAWARADTPQRILDIGTGTGLLALMLAQRYPDAHVLGIDIDEKAIDLATENVGRVSWAEKVEIKHESLQDFAKTSTDKFDLIVSNPPFFTGGTFSSDANRNTIRQTIKMSHTDLLRASHTLTGPAGNLKVILPFLEGLRFIEVADMYGFDLEKKVEVYGKEGKKATRLLLAFSKGKIKFPEMSKLVIRDAEGKYLPEYLNLVEPYYENEK